MSSEFGYSIGAVFHPTDFSKPSEAAFHHALRLALSNKSHLYIMHVGTHGSRDVDWLSFPQVRKTLENWGELKEGTAREEIADKLGIKVQKIEIGSRNPAVAISNFLEDKPPGLIVLSTEGRHGLPAWFNPSVAEDLARRTFAESAAAKRASIAAMFVPSGAKGFVGHDTGEAKLNCVLVPVDHEPDPQIAMETAGAFVSCLGAQDLIIETLFVGDQGQAPVVEPPNGFETCVSSTFRAGDAADEIVRAAAEQSADLIIMTTAGRHGFLDVLRGSTTEQVLRRAPCPVLAVPA